MMQPELQAIIASDGNVDLAAERLNITPVALMGQVLSADTDEKDFARAIRAAVALNVIDILAHVRVALQARSDDLSGVEMSRLLGVILAGLGSIFPPPSEASVVTPSTQLLQIFEGGNSDAREKISSRIDSMAAAGQAAGSALES